jgi:hypothetical protein
MVEVMLAVKLQIGWWRRQVIGILLEEGHACRSTVPGALVLRDPSQDFLGEGRFARTGSPGDPNEEHH